MRTSWAGWISVPDGWLTITLVIWNKNYTFRSTAFLLCLNLLLPICDWCSESLHRNPWRRAPKYMLQWPVVMLHFSSLISVFVLPLFCVYKSITMTDCNNLQRQKKITWPILPGLSFFILYTKKILCQDLLFYSRLFSYSILLPEFDTIKMSEETVKKVEDLSIKEAAAPAEVVLG